MRIGGCRNKVRTMVWDRVNIMVKVRDKVRVINRVRRCLNE